METLLIIALLASNVWLIRKVLTKPDVQSVGKNENGAAPEPPPADEAPPEEVVGKSSFDADKFMDSFREIAKEAATEAAREVVPLIVMELGKPSDAGLPDTPEEKPRMQIPPEKLDEIFSTHSVSEYNRENETSTILKRNEQIFSFFASFFSCSFDRLNIILTPIKSHSKRLKIGVSLCFLSCLLRHSGQTLQLHFRPKVRAFSLHCSRKCERFQGST